MALASTHPLALAWRLRIALHSHSALYTSFPKGSLALSTSTASLKGENAADADADSEKEKSTSTSTPSIKKEEAKSKKPGDKEEIGGPKGPEPTRFNDWERKGRVSDF